MAASAAHPPYYQFLATAEAVARQAAARMAHRFAGRAGHAPTVRLQTTGEVARLRRIAAAWLPFPCRVEAVEPAPVPA